MQCLWHSVRSPAQIRKDMLTSMPPTAFTAPGCCYAASASGPFDLIYADPPWHFETSSNKGQGKSPSAHYATLDIDAICRLPVRDIAAPDSALACGYTARFSTKPSR